MESKMERAKYLCSKMVGYDWRVSSDKEYERLHALQEDIELRNQVEQEINKLELTNKEYCEAMNNIDYNVANRVYRGWDY